MTVIATDSGNRLSNVVKHEYEPSLAYCRELVTVYEAAETDYVVGTVIGRYLSGGTATAAAAAGNTGTGTVGAITVTGEAQIGVYTLKIVTAAANAGDFNVYDPSGDLIGSGTVAVVFNQGGLSFTLADGIDFVVGDTIYISVAGTEKVKVCKATATDGSQVAYGVVVGDDMGDASDFTVAATTDTKAIAIVRGPVILSKALLTLDATIDTAAEKNAVYAALAAKGIVLAETV